MKKLKLISIAVFFSASSIQANSDCRKKHKGILEIVSYNECVANAENSSTATKEAKIKKKNKALSTMKKMVGKLNTDSTLLKTGKYSKDK